MLAPNSAIIMNVSCLSARGKDGKEKENPYKLQLINK